MSVYPKRIMTFDRFDNAVFGLFGLLNERPKDAVPDDQCTSIIFIQILFINAVMHPVMRRCVKDVFKPAEPIDELCVDPKLVDQVQTVHKSKHPRRKSQQHYRSVKDPVGNTREPAL